jgi:flavin reductase (DIM6/NTAB) family NADH-FMN oxidoreductase RutF
MDLPWGSNETTKFATNVGLITSNGPHGNNIMAAEWTHHVSYSPGLVMINIGYGKATEENILKTKEFGINIAASDQNIVSSVAGKGTGAKLDKIAILKDLGIEFYKAKKINVLMVKGAAMNGEFRVIDSFKLGDHRAFIGELLSITVSEKEPLIYSRGKFWKLGENIAKPPKMLEKIDKIIEKHKKK